jgi:ZIP family zinc transporter
VAHGTPGDYESIDHATDAAPFGPASRLRRIEAARGRCGFFRGPAKEFVIEFLRDIGPVGQAFVATLGTYLLTAAGTLPVLFFTTAPRRLMDAMMGFAAGVMVAASCWSLLVPAIERGGVGRAVIGLLLGAALLYAADQLLPHLHGEFPDEARAEGPRVIWGRSTLLMLAMTLHNFPEGMAIGVSFGGGDLGPALALAIGIGLQNVPEGLAIALPLRRAGMSRGRAFFWGQLSAAIEPVGGVLGAWVVLAAGAFLPYGMAAAAGAMLYVVVEELLPETTRSGTADVATLGFIVGFVVMMALDNALG